MRAGIALATLSLVLLPACSPPKRDYDVQQIARVQDLSELMYVQATVADDLMKTAARLEPAEVDDGLFTRYADMGRRLQAAAQRMIPMRPEPGFADYARTQQRQAALLETSANGRDAGQTLKAARAIRTTCKACHQDFR